MTLNPITGNDDDEAQPANVGGYQLSTLDQHQPRGMEAEAPSYAQDYMGPQATPKVKPPVPMPVPEAEPQAPAQAPRPTPADIMALMPGADSTTATQRTKVAPEYRNGMDASNAAIPAQIDAAEKVGKANVESAKIEQEQAAAKQSAIEAQQAHAEEVRQAAKAKVAEADDYLKQQRDQYAKDGNITPYWADKSTGARVMASIMVGIGQYAATMSGTQNTALKILDDAMARDFQLKKEKVAKSREMVRLAREDQQTASQRMQYAEVEIRNQQIAMLEMLGAKREAALAKSGVSKAEAASDAYNADMKQRSAQLQMQNTAVLNQQVTSSQSNAGEHAMQRQIALAQVTAGAGGGAPDELGIYGPNGVKLGRAPQKEIAKKLSEEMPNYVAARDIIEKLKESVKQHGKVFDAGRLLTPENHRYMSERDELRERLKMLLRADEGLRMSVTGSSDPEKSENILDKQIGDRGTLFSGDPTHKLEVLQGTMDTKMRAQLSAAGINGDKALELLNKGNDTISARARSKEEGKEMVGRDGKTYRVSRRPDGSFYMEQA